MHPCNQRSGEDACNCSAPALFTRDRHAIKRESRSSVVANNMDVNVEKLRGVGELLIKSSATSPSLVARHVSSWRPLALLFVYVN